MMSLITKRKLEYLVSWYGFCSLFGLLGEGISVFNSGFDVQSVILSFVVVVFGLGSLVAFIGMPSTDEIVRELFAEHRLKQKRVVEG
jgi:hypothetical protein